MNALDIACFRRDIASRHRARIFRRQTRDIPTTGLSEQQKAMYAAAMKPYNDAVNALVERPDAFQ